MRPKTVSGKLIGSKANYYMDEELRDCLGTVRKKTWILVIMLIAAALFVQSHVQHDLNQEREIWRLYEYITHLEKKTSIYYYKVKELEKNKYICVPP